MDSCLLRMNILYIKLRVIKPNIQFFFFWKMFGSSQVAMEKKDRGKIQNDTNDNFLFTRRFTMFFHPFVQTKINLVCHLPTS